MPEEKVTPVTLYKIDPKNTYTKTTYGEIEHINMNANNRACFCLLVCVLIVVLVALRSVYTVNVCNDKTYDCKIYPMLCEKYTCERCMIRTGEDFNCENYTKKDAFDFQKDPYLKIWIIIFVIPFFYIIYNICMVEWSVNILSKFHDKTIIHYDYRGKRNISDYEKDHYLNKRYAIVAGKGLKCLDYWEKNIPTKEIDLTTQELEIIQTNEKLLFESLNNRNKKFGVFYIVLSIVYISTLIYIGYHERHEHFQCRSGELSCLLVPELCQANGCIECIDDHEHKGKKENYEKTFCTRATRKYFENSHKADDQILCLLICSIVLFCLGVDMFSDYKMDSCRTIKDIHDYQYANYITDLKKQPHEILPFAENEDPVADLEDDNDATQDDNNTQDDNANDKEKKVEKKPQHEEKKPHEVDSDKESIITKNKVKTIVIDSDDDVDSDVDSRKNRPITKKSNSQPIHKQKHTVRLRTTCKK